LLNLGPSGNFLPTPQFEPTESASPRSYLVSRILYSSAHRLLLATALLVIPLWGQQVPEPPAAPVPSQIPNAKKIFISNAGEKSSYWLRRMNTYSGGPNRAYNQFYAAMKNWGQCDLVSTPAEADLVFEIHFEVEFSRAADESSLRLLVLDPKTHTTLWGFTSYVEPANKAKTRDRNYDMAMTILVNEAKSLLYPQPAAAQK
jgi:hypothetical protein